LLILGRFVDFIIRLVVVLDCFAVSSSFYYCSSSFCCFHHCFIFSYLCHVENILNAHGEDVLETNDVDSVTLTILLSGIARQFLETRSNAAFAYMVVSNVKYNCFVLLLIRSLHRSKS
jgi:hypothetical protein